MKSKLPYLLGLFLLLFSLSAFGQSFEPLEITIKRMPNDDPLMLDGYKDELYSYADSIAFERWDVDATIQAIDSAKAWLAYDDNNLYGFVTIWDSEPLNNDDELSLGIDIGTARKADDVLSWPNGAMDENAFLFSKVQKGNSAPHEFRQLTFYYTVSGNSWNVEFYVPWDEITTDTDTFDIFWARKTFFLDMGIKNNGIEDEFLGWSNDDNSHWHSSMKAAVATLSEDELEPDLIDPTVTCPDNQTVTANNDDLYVVNGTEFDPVEMDDNNGIAIVTNNFNQAETLDGAEIAVGSQTITWKVVDGGGNRETCSVTITVNSKTDIEEYRQAGISLWPNPVKDLLHLNFVQPEDIKMLTISTVAGQLVLSLNHIEKKEVIDMSAFESGLYIINIQTNKHTISSQIIKK